jgi:hypothetical protein
LRALDKLGWLAAVKADAALLSRWFDDLWKASQPFPATTTLTA